MEAKNEFYKQKVDCFNPLIKKAPGHFFSQFDREFMCLCLHGLKSTIFRSFVVNLAVYIFACLAVIPVVNR